MAAVSIIFVLVLAAAALVAAIVVLVRNGGARGGTLSATTRWVVALIGLALFVFLGAGALNTITDRKASPEETMPWLVLIGLAAGSVWIAAQKGVFSRRPSTRAAALPNRKPGQPESPDTEVKIRQPARAEASASVLISYRRADSGDVTGRIYDRLVSHYGRDTVFKDVDSIPLGVDFRKHLADSVGNCRVLLAVIGRNWLVSGDRERRLNDPRDFVRIEVETAIERGIPIVPLLVQGAAMPREEDLPPSLRPLVYYNAIAIRPDPDFHQDVTRLIKGVEAHIGEKTY